MDLSKIPDHELDALRTSVNGEQERRIAIAAIPQEMARLKLRYEAATTAPSKDVTLTRGPSVAGYGTTGDGMADDTAALRAALAGEPSVYLPPGTYRHTGPLTLREGQSLVGAGLTLSRLVNAGTGPSVIIDGTTHHEIRGLEIRGSVTSSHGIEVRGAISAYIAVRDARIYAAGGNGIYAGHAGHVNNMVVEASEVLACGLDGVNIQYGAGQVNAVWVQRCNVSQNARNGVTFYGNSVSIDRNTIQANGRHGVAVGDETTHDATKYCLGSAITRNYFEQNGTAATSGAAPLGVYVGYYLDGRPANRVVRSLDISGNYFAETGEKYASLVRVVDLNLTDPSSRASVIHTRGNYGDMRLLSWAGQCPLSYGFTIDEDLSIVMPADMLAALPKWVQVRGNHTPPA